MGASKNLVPWSTAKMVGVDATTDITAHSLTVDHDIEITTATNGVIEKDSNGDRWRITVETDGSLKRTKL